MLPHGLPGLFLSDSRLRVQRDIGYQYRGELDAIAVVDAEKDLRPFHGDSLALDSIGTACTEIQRDIPSGPASRRKSCQGPLE
jgi:hypothetical protein